ncbi:MAG: hypothetical protein QOI35_992 [Cryptosporangiaceae bacterium]|nr:hypothetical protein [Cryptosporangiaceae bacterium]
MRRRGEAPQATVLRSTMPRSIRIALPLALVGWLVTASGCTGPTSGQESPAALTLLPQPSPMAAPVQARPSAAPPASPLAVPAVPSQPLKGAPFAGTPAVGSLARVSGSTVTGHSCTASVVHSPAHNLVVTAAHCLGDDEIANPRRIAFVPGYHTGSAPYGIFVAHKVTVDPHWTENADPDYDVAFLTVDANDSGQVEEAAGANTLGIGRQPGALTATVGYPKDSESPIVCRNYTRKQSDTQLRFDCAEYTAGTSGGPLITDVDPTTGRGTVVGVVGGYQEGGETPDISYSPYFGNQVSGLYRAATASA